MLERVIRACPDVSFDRELWAPIVQHLAEQAETAEPRDAAGCARVLAMLRAQNIDVLRDIVKEKRLDNGDPTERVEHQVYAATFDRLG